MPATARRTSTGSSDYEAMRHTGCPEEYLPEPGPHRSAYEEALAQDEARRIRVRRAGQAIVDSEGWKVPPASMPLSYARKHPPEPVEFFIDGILAKGAKVLVVASYKTGKTTLHLDQACSLAAGEPWLGKFEVDFPEGNVGYWNIELAENRMFDWLDTRCDEDPIVAERLVTAHLRGYRMNLNAQPCADWTRRWLNDNDIRIWYIDPLGRHLSEENSNTEFNDWWGRMEEIVADSPVSAGAVVLIHHAGHGEPGQDVMPRGRGASAMGGNPDDLFFFRHGGRNGELPPDESRYLNGIGRNVEMDAELVLDYDRATRRFTAESADGNRTRMSDTAHRRVDKVVERLTLELLRKKVNKLNYRELEAVLPFTAKDKSTAIRAAVEAEAIHEEKMGRGRPTWYRLPE